MKNIKKHLYLLFALSFSIYILSMSMSHLLLRVFCGVLMLSIWVFFLIRIGRECQIFKKKTEEHIQREISDLSVEMFRRKAEYSALQSQINPHFLYNTLETIRSQSIIDGNKEIAEMVKRLSMLFRYSISRTGETVALREEINNICNYMKIMEFRFDHRFALEIDVDEEEHIYDLYVPRLILQPIVENAISHGLDERVLGGIIRIEAVLADDLILTVSDNGKGMTLNELDELNKKIHTYSMSEKEDDKTKGSGVALPNVNQRIQLLYGKKYGLNLYSSENCGTDVEIILPVVNKKGSKNVGENDFESK